MSQADVLRSRIYRSSEATDRELEELSALVGAYLELHPDDLSLADEASILAREIEGRRYLPLRLRDRQSPIERP
jgi:hypothetical protein